MPAKPDGSESIPLTAEHVQTKREIQTLFAAGGLRPRKGWGQHFLIDGNLMRRLVTCAELNALDTVLEVGAGTGGLSELIARRARRLVCVEKDRALGAILKERFRDTAGVTVILGDILESKHRLAAAVARTIAEHADERDGSLKLVANLPYRIAAPLLMNLLIDHPQVRRLCFTVQSEVGQRLMAGPDCKAYGPLSIVAGLLGSVRRIVRIPPEAFWPRPAVHSVMLRMDVGEAPFPDRDELRRFVAVVRAMFDYRRKTLRAAMSYVFDQPQRDLVRQHVDVGRRPESLSIEEWIELHRLVEAR